MTRFTRHAGNGTYDNTAQWTGDGEVGLPGREVCLLPVKGDGSYCERTEKSSM